MRHSTDTIATSANVRNFANPRMVVMVASFTVASSFRTHQSHDIGEHRGRGIHRSGCRSRPCVCGMHVCRKVFTCVGCTCVVFEAMRSPCGCACAYVHKYHARITRGDDIDAVISLVREDDARANVRFDWWRCQHTEIQWITRRNHTYWCVVRHTVAPYAGVVDDFSSTSPAAERLTCIWLRANALSL